MATRRTTTVDAPADAPSDALPPEAYATEQEKDPNPGPLTPPVEPGPAAPIVETAAKEPYPTGNPPDPEDAFEQAHGFRRAPPDEGAPPVPPEA